MDDVQLLADFTVRHFQAVGKRDVILLSYFLEMTDREISEKLNIVHQAVSKRRLVTLKELREYLMKEGFEWSDK